MKQVSNTINVLSTELSRHRRNMASQSPRAFAEVYMKNNCNEPFSEMHEQIFGLLFEMTDKRKARLAIAAPRGHAKSTIGRNDKVHIRVISCNLCCDQGTDTFLKAIREAVVA